MSKKVFVVIFAAAIVVAVHVGVKTAEAAIFNDLAALEQSDDFALDRMFDSTGWLAGRNADGGYVAGSGVLIDPYWVLTAGHVAFDPFVGGNTLWAEMEFSTSPSVYDGPQNLISADLVFVFDGYHPDIPVGGGDDIALVRLSEPIYDVDPAVRFRGTDQEGTHFYAAGFGSPGIWPDQPGIPEFDGIKRAGENIADSFGGLGGIVQEQYWLSTLDDGAEALPLEWSSSFLDSGGGWYSDIDGQMQLIAMTNFTRGQSTMTGGIRLSLYNDWIDETMEANAVPEPATWVMFLSGLLGWLGLGGRRRNVV